MQEFFIHFTSALLITAIASDMLHQHKNLGGVIPPGIVTCCLIGLTIAGLLV